MSNVNENAGRRRRWRSPLSLPSYTEHDVLANNIIDEFPHNSGFWNWLGRILSDLLDSAVTMHRSTRTALIAIAILLCVIVVILLLNLESIKSSFDNGCITINSDETCHATNLNPYRFYGTKTAYHIVQRTEDSSHDLDVGECVPKVFYLLSRHATRYPDKEHIQRMVQLLPDIQAKIINKLQSGEVKMCKEDIKNLENWVVNLKPEFDNKMSDTGLNETIELAERFKAKFPTLLDQRYSPDKFVFEFTSKERTRSTAEAFAEGLFGKNAKNISFPDSTNDDVLNFHKACKVMQKACKSSNHDISEIDKFETGSLMQEVVESVSKRIGVELTYDDIKLIHKACAFDYALDTGDTWCSLFTTDELKVLEFNDDIDDYYKDAYGNQINYIQACPVVKHVMDLFEEFQNTSESKSVMQFSHAGSIKKVFAIFGLFKDEKPLTADDFCSQQKRSWRSSIVAPFTTNLALVLYECGSEFKIAAFHNENPVKLGGCTDLLCSYEEFSQMYNPIAEHCDINKICSTCTL